MKVSFGKIMPIMSNTYGNTYKNNKLIKKKFIPTRLLREDEHTILKLIIGREGTRAWINSKIVIADSDSRSVHTQNMGPCH